MKRTGMLAVVGAVVLACSCNDPTFVKYDSSYAFTRPARPVSCAVMIPEKIDVTCRDGVEDVFGRGEPSALVDSFFRTQLCNELKLATIFDPVFNGGTTNAFVKRTVLLQHGDIDARITVPEARQRVECRGIVPDFVIFLQNVMVASTVHESEVSGGSYSVHSGPNAMGASFSEPGRPIVTKNLTIAAFFAVWDNLSGRVVSYGCVESEDMSVVRVSLQDYLETMSDFVSKIVEGTPFKSTRGSY